MAEQPSNTDLAWRLEQIQRNLTELVGRPEYTARQEAATTKLAELQADILTLDRKLEDHERSHHEAHHNWRTLIYTGVLPALVAVLAIVTQIIIAHGGK